MPYHDNMPTVIKGMPEELPDDIEAIITYNDGAHYQLVLKRQGLKIIGYRGSKPSQHLEYDSGGIQKIPSEPGIPIYAAPKIKSSSFRQKQASAVRAFMRPQGRKIE